MSDDKLVRNHARKLASPSAAKELNQKFDHFPDREDFPNRLEEFARADSKWKERSAEEIANLRNILGGSAFLSQYLVRHPEDLSFASKISIPEESKTYSSHEIRRRKYQTFLALFTKRCNADIDIQEEWKWLSDLADHLITSSLKTVESELETSMLEVVAFGKLGAQELNVSSDIDLLYLRHADAPLGSEENCARLANQHAKLLQEKNEEGFGYRVDLRLRPGGNQGPLVGSAASIERFYEMSGKTWERAVWLRARSVTNGSATSEVMNILKPFIYRRHLDYGTLDDLGSMKLQIDTALGSSEASERNIKLGFGGIRETEFLVQTLQLIHAGKTTEIRCRSTLDSLKALADSGIMKDEVADDLHRAYLLFRDVEHAVQWDCERQTHDLPNSTDLEGWRKLEARCPAHSRLQERVKKERETVHEHFERLFLPEKRPREAYYFDARFQDEAAFTRLEELLKSRGVKKTEDAQPLFKTIQKHIYDFRFTRRGERHFRRLLPLLMEKLLRNPDAPIALERFIHFVMSTRARSAYYATLADNPATLQLLLSLFGTSEFLSTTFMQNPELLDTLIMRTHASGSSITTIIDQDMAKLEKEMGDFEKALDRLREIRREHLLRISLTDLGENANWPEISNELTYLAESLVQKAFALTKEHFPRARQVRLAVIGMGTLGAKEMGYASDLDLLFLFEPKSKSREKDQEIAVKWAQRLISALSIPTRAGTLYQVDTRLRPSGRQGMLVSSLDALRSYHSGQAQLWERHALLRGRAIAGDEALMKDFEDFRKEKCFSTTFSTETLKEMRNRLEAELAKETSQKKDLKLGRGGLADIEFLIATFQLRHGKDEEKLQGVSTLSLLEALNQKKYLDSEKVKMLKEGYIFLRTLENRLRLQENRAISTFSLEKNSLKKLARSFSLGPLFPVESADDLAEVYRTQTDNIRRAFEGVVGEVR